MIPTSQGGDCAEVAAHPFAIRIRGSKAPTGPTLTLSPATWNDFLKGIQQPQKLPPPKSPPPPPSKPPPSPKPPPKSPGSKSVPETSPPS